MSDIVLQPGEYCVADASHRIRTLLGSCVSIVLWHERLRIGAMSHFLLSGGSRTPDHLDARYAEDALLLMSRELVRWGVSPEACQAKLFGGGNMFPGLTSHGLTNIGHKNGEVARELVRAHGITISSESLFGVGHRHIIFDVASGNVWVRQAELDADSGRMEEPI